MALRAVESAEHALEAARERQPEDPPPSFFTDLGTALERVWDAPETTHRDRKRLLACLVEEVTLQLVEEGRTEVVIHWRGGRADAFSVKRRKRRPVRRRDDIDTVELVRRLARFYPDGQVAGILNGQGRRSARGLRFSASLVESLRRRHDVPAYRKPAAGEEEDGELLSVRAAARELGVADSTLYRWVNAGILPGVRPDVPGAPLRVRMGADFPQQVPSRPAGGVRSAPGGCAAPWRLSPDGLAKGRVREAGILPREARGRPRPLRPAGGGRASALRRNAPGPGARQCVTTRLQSHSVKLAASRAGRRFRPPTAANLRGIADPGPDTRVAPVAACLARPVDGRSRGRNGDSARLPARSHRVKPGRRICRDCEASRIVIVLQCVAP